MYCHNDKSIIEEKTKDLVKHIACLFQPVDSAAMFYRAQAACAGQVYSLLYTRVDLPNSTVMTHSQSYKIMIFMLPIHIVVIWS